MNDFLADKVIEEFQYGKISVRSAWQNLLEIKDSISDEKHDEIVSLIIEELINSEVIDESQDEIVLKDIFSEQEWEDDDWDISDEDISYFGS